MQISLLLPTRQRPHWLRRMADSAVQTANRPDQLQLVTYVDDDDASYDDMAMTLPWERVRGPRLHDGKVNLSVKWNECWQRATGEIYMHCGDDIIFRTPGWDDAVRDAINDAPANIAFVWCDDGSPNNASAAFGTHGFVHRNWTNIIGRFVPPYFVSDFNDTWFNDVAAAIHAKRYLAEHLTEHMHYIWGKAAKDQNTIERLERHEADNPRELYESQDMIEERFVEIVHLRHAIQAAS